MKRVALIGLIALALMLSGCVEETDSSVSDEEYNKNIDYSCTVDADCVIKPVGCDVCVGSKMGCVNQDSIEGICSRVSGPVQCMGMTAIPNGCKCENNECVGIR